MSWVIDYFRKCFCNHKWELLTEKTIYKVNLFRINFYDIRHYRCKKCGKTNKVKLK